MRSTAGACTSSRAWPAGGASTGTASGSACGPSSTRRHAPHRSRRRRLSHAGPSGRGGSSPPRRAVGSRSCLAVSKRRRIQRAADVSATGKREKVRDVFVPRPFEGLADEPEWIALRELVPAASAPLRLVPELVEEHGDRPVTLATVLPMAAPAMTKADGRVRRPPAPPAVRRRLPGPGRGAALRAAYRAGPDGHRAAAARPRPPPPGHPGRRAAGDQHARGLRVLARPGAADDPTVQASLERANAAIYPTVRLAAARAAYWCQVPEKAHVRWVLPDDEDAALDALARLSAAGTLPLAGGTKFAGMFRAHGRLVPVWDLPEDVPAADWEEPVRGVRRALCRGPRREGAAGRGGPPRPAAACSAGSSPSR